MRPLSALVFGVVVALVICGLQFPVMAQCGWTDTVSCPQGYPRLSPANNKESGNEWDHGVYEETTQYISVHSLSECDTQDDVQLGGPSANSASGHANTGRIVTRTYNGNAGNAPAVNNYGVTFSGNGDALASGQAIEGPGGGGSATVSSSATSSLAGSSSPAATTQPSGSQKAEGSADTTDGKPATAKVTLNPTVNGDGWTVETTGADPTGDSYSKSSTWALSVTGTANLAAGVGVASVTTIITTLSDCTTGALAGATGASRALGKGEANATLSGNFAAQW